MSMLYIACFINFKKGYSKSCSADCSWKIMGKNKFISNDWFEKNYNEELLRGQPDEKKLNDC